jgi:hypothetical protein
MIYTLSYDINKLIIDSASCLIKILIYYRIASYSFFYNMENARQQKFRSDISCLYDWMSIINREKKTKLKPSTLKPTQQDNKQ